MIYTAKPQKYRKIAKIFSSMITTNRELRSSEGNPIKMTYAQLNILRNKGLLLRWYRYIYRFIVKNIAQGRNNLEIGSGSSLLYEQIPGLIKSNILYIKENNLVLNALQLPFKDGVLDNIILIDVLHHLTNPIIFLEEARRILRTDGRILICDPYISFGSFILWRYIHPEGCNTRTIGFKKEHDINPLMDANSASATNLFCKDFKAHLGGLKIIKMKYHTKFYYWFAGGYNFPQFLPTFLFWVIDFMEFVFSGLNKFLASFLFVVLEKNIL